MYCDKCFKKIEKPEDHADWCPYSPDYDIPEVFEELFNNKNPND